jgi:drug/metabolite transporter (DMT)-like permease
VSRRLKADLLLLLCTAIWGATFVIVKDALADASVFAFLALRFALATAALAAVYPGHLRRMKLADVRAGMVIGACMFGGYTFQTLGIRLTTPSKAAFITGFCVVLVPVFLAIFGRRKAHAWIWTGAAAALAGVYLLAIPASGFAELNRGDLLVFFGAIGFALHIISIGHYSPKHPPAVLTFVQIATTAALVTAGAGVAWLTGFEPPRVAWTGELIAAIALTGVLATALTFSVQVWAQQHTSSAHTAILFAFEPVWAALTSYLVLHERMSGRAMTGAALILAGILLAELKGKAPAMAERA